MKFHSDEAMLNHIAEVFSEFMTHSDKISYFPHIALTMYVSMCIDTPRYNYKTHYNILVEKVECSLKEKNIFDKYYKCLNGEYIKILDDVPALAKNKDDYICEYCGVEVEECYPLDTYLEKRICHVCEKEISIAEKEFRMEKARTNIKIALEKKYKENVTDDKEIT